MFKKKNVSKTCLQFEAKIQQKNKLGWSINVSIFAQYLRYQYYYM